MLIKLDGIGPGFLEGPLLTLPDRKVVFRGPAVPAPAFAPEVTNKQGLLRCGPKIVKRFPSTKTDRLGVRAFICLHAFRCFVPTVIYENCVRPYLVARKGDFFFKILHVFFKSL